MVGLTAALRDLRVERQRRFEISGLSGTSAGALNAFMVWYGMILKNGQKGGWLIVPRPS